MSGRKTLADVPDDSGPIMAVASLTPNDKPTKENPSPFKQIAIEALSAAGQRNLDRRAVCARKAEGAGAEERSEEVVAGSIARVEVAGDPHLAFKVVSSGIPLEPPASIARPSQARASRNGLGSLAEQFAPGFGGGGGVLPGQLP